MVRLRLVELADVDELSGWLREPGFGGDYQWFGFRSKPKMREAVEAGESIADDRGWLAVVADDGTLLGNVQWFPQLHGPTPGAHALMIGCILSPHARGKGFGTEAHRLIVGYLLDHYPVNRIEAATDIENLAEQRVLEKAGFTREGVLRGSSWRMGEWHDSVLFSFLRSDQA